MSNPILSSFPPHMGVTFTTTYHTTLTSTTDPSSVSLPLPFVAVVTGAGKGLGYHIALAYAKAGASGIAISSRTQSDLDTLSYELYAVAKARGSALEVLSQICDTQSLSSIETLEIAVREKFHRADVVIANAGVISKYIPDAEQPGDLKHRLPQGIVEDADFARVVDINLLGSWRTAKTFLPLLKSSPDGLRTFILITSLAGHSSNSAFTTTAYNVSKLASNRLVEHIDSDHGLSSPRAEGICAYALHPGTVLTPQTQQHTGAVWEKVLGDDVALCGGVCVWLSRRKREWLSGRYVSVNWDFGELEGMRDRIVEGDLLKFRMAV